MKAEKSSIPNIKSHILICNLQPIEGFYPSSEATNENQIGLFLLLWLAPDASRITWAEVDSSPEDDAALLRFAARSLLRFTGPGSKDVPLLLFFAFVCSGSFVFDLGIYD